MSLGGGKIVFFCNCKRCWSPLASRGITPMGGGLTSDIWMPINIDWARTTRRRSRASTSTSGRGRCFKPVDLLPSRESERTINVSEGRDDHPSAALPLLPRDGHCQAWFVTWKVFHRWGSRCRCVGQPQLDG